MEQNSEKGFSIMELMVATGALLVVLSGALYFFSRSQVVYSNERATLDMVQDLRTTFDRFTNEIRMAGAGFPGYRGVVSGTANTLIVRGDFGETTTIVTSAGTNGTGVLGVGTTNGLAVGQTISLLNTVTGASAVTTITGVNSNNNTITISAANLFPVTGGATLSNFEPGSIINVVERRTYGVITSGADKGAITRTVAFENTQVAGAVVQSQEIIARNVLTTDAQGNEVVGLRFTYLNAADAVIPIDPVTGFVDPNQVAKVRIDLQARTAARDLQTREYRTLNLSSVIQIRGQYIPGQAGF